MKLSWNIENSNFGNPVSTSKSYTMSKKGLKVQKRFQNMEVKNICANFVLMELINILVFSGDVIGDINMKNTHLFTFGNRKLQHMSSTT